MKAWFIRLTRREQLIVFLLGILLGWLLFYSMAWAPVSNAIAGYQAANKSAEENLEWMRQATLELQQGRGEGGQAATVQSISSLIDSSLPMYKLVMLRYQPTGDDETQLWLEDAALPQVIAWLVAMERDYGMRMVNVSIASSDKEGMVKARVRMSKP